MCKLTKSHLVHQWWKKYYICPQNLEIRKKETRVWLRVPFGDNELSVYCTVCLRIKVEIDFFNNCCGDNAQYFSLRCSGVKVLKMNGNTPVKQVPQNCTWVYVRCYFTPLCIDFKNHILSQIGLEVSLFSNLTKLSI